MMVVGETMSATVKFWICLVPDLLLGKNIDKMKKYRYVATLDKILYPRQKDEIQWRFN